MRIGPLIAGIILLIMAIIGFTAASNSISEGQTLVGQAGRAFVPGQAQAYNEAQYLQLGSGGLGVIGFGLLIYGAAAKGGDSKIKKWKNPSEYLREEYQAGYEEVRPKDVPIKSQEKSSEKDDIRFMGILKERLAKGEITKEEYDDLKKEFEK